MTNILSRHNVARAMAEVFGTAVLTFSILAVSRSAIGVPYFIALGVGLTMAILVLTISSVSGAHVNPAVTIGLWTAGKIKAVSALVYVAAQFAGAALAYQLYNYLVELGVQNAAVGDFRWEVLVAELVGTAVFTFGIAAALANKYQGGQLAATVGGSLAVGILVAGVASNGIINPAAALGVQSWSKAYVIGPILGGVIGINLYTLLFAGESHPLARLSSKKATSKKSAKRK